jgi:type II secretory ATPase GspE/PulE/Tfp pilus assembly ATPase PilB-like protein
VNQVLADALAQRATDVHLEPYEDEFRIRYRVDGVLLDAAVPTPIKRFPPAIVARIKILSHLDIAEKRVPQDGRIKIRMEKGDVDVRVSVIPMLHGEAVVLRLLRQDSPKYGLGELKMGERELRMLRDSGVTPRHLLVTGRPVAGKRRRSTPRSPR